MLLIIYGVLLGLGVMGTLRAVDRGKPLLGACCVLLALFSAWLLFAELTAPA